jgi:hypothetical protein
MRRLPFALIFPLLWTSVASAEGDYRFYNAVSGTDHYRVWIFGAQSGRWTASPFYLAPGDFWEQSVFGGNYYIRLEDVNRQARDVGWKDLGRYSKADVYLGFRNTLWRKDPATGRMIMFAAAPSGPGSDYTAAVRPRRNDDEADDDNRVSLRPPQVSSPPLVQDELQAGNLGISYEVIRYSDGTIGARLTRFPAPNSGGAQIGLEPGDVVFALDNVRFQQPGDILNHRYQTSVYFVNVRTGMVEVRWANLP